MIDKNKLPEHVAFIMDGNGRWAQEKGLPRVAGHRTGVKRVKEIVKAAQELGIKVVTFFAFSTENWARPKKEIDMLMFFLNNFLDNEIKDLNRNNIRFVTIGEDDPIPKNIQVKIAEAENKTKSNGGLVMVLALNYGGRREIVEAVKKVADSVKRGKLNINDLDEANLGGYLYTAGLPDPDLLIRTSGEMRISNFLLWQLSYAELYFTKEYWPNFGKAEFEKALEEYQGRERKFGRINVK